jgi:hypothetical protein
VDLNSKRVEVAAALQNLERRLASLTEGLAHGEFSITLDGHSSSSATRRACEAYAAIDYQSHEDEANASPVCIGVIGANADTLRRANVVNEAKEEFKALCAPLHRVQVRVPVKGEKKPTKTMSAMRVILRNIQRSDLNLLAAYRKIPILDAPPKSITFTRANTRAVYRKSVEEIAALLNNVSSPTAIVDRELIANLDRRVTHLALVKERYQNIRANILFARLDSKGRGRIQISAELPLLFASGRRGEPPEVRFPGEPGSAKTRRKRESKLEAVAFLRSLPVYRYGEQ